MEIGTSDRTLFKRCRRRWNWQSQSRMGLQSKEPNNIHLFIGTGIHFALEDWHGFRRYPAAKDAFVAYVQAHKPEELPTLWTDDDMETCIKMLQYYSTSWHDRHFKDLKTVWIESEPLVEVRFSIPFKKALRLGSSDRLRGSNYTGTFDRIVQDEYERYWVMDYKTAGQFDTAKLETDPQISAYTWAAQEVFGTQFEGVIWVQMLKDYPKNPRRLQNGSISKAKDQRTTYEFMRAALIEEYGEVPQEYVEIVNHFASLEGEFGDKFIRFDKVYKNQHSVANEKKKILAEAREMNSRTLALYPNPTRDCSWDCPFRTPCIALDDGADYEFILSENYEKAPVREERDFWRSRLERMSLPIHIEV